MRFPRRKLSGIRILRLLLNRRRKVLKKWRRSKTARERRSNSKFSLRTRVPDFLRKGINHTCRKIRIRPSSSRLTSPRNSLTMTRPISWRRLKMWISWRPSQSMPNIFKAERRHLRIMMRPVKKRTMLRKHMLRNHNNKYCMQKAVIVTLSRVSPSKRLEKSKTKNRNELTLTLQIVPSWVKLRHKEEVIGNNSIHVSADQGLSQPTKMALWSQLKKVD